MDSEKKDPDIAKNGPEVEVIVDNKGLEKTTVKTKEAKCRGWWHFLLDADTLPYYDYTSTEYSIKVSIAAHCSGVRLGASPGVQGKINNWKGQQTTDRIMLR